MFQYNLNEMGKKCRFEKKHLYFCATEQIKKCSTRYMISENNQEQTDRKYCHRSKLVNISLPPNNKKRSETTWFTLLFVYSYRKCHETSRQISSCKVY